MKSAEQIDRMLTCKHRDASMVLVCNDAGEQWSEMRCRECQWSSRRMSVDMPYELALGAVFIPLCLFGAAAFFICGIVMFFVHRAFECAAFTVSALLMAGYAGYIFLRLSRRWPSRQQPQSARVA